MKCTECQSEARKFGKDRKGNQRFQCMACRKTFSHVANRPLGDMRITMKEALTVLKMLVEGMSIRATERVTGTAKRTILNLLETVGSACERMMFKRLVDLPVRDVQCDEVWGFVGCKEATRKRKRADEDEIGDAYCFTALERDTKLLIAWHLGRRTSEDAHDFACNLAYATMGNFQLTTDGFKPYQTAMPSLLKDCDFATLVKTYATKEDDQHKYSPGEVTGTEKRVCCGNPDPDFICTSHVERYNLTIRMQNRRMTRLTNAFSKKWINHRYMLALSFAHYNWVRKHQTIETTPAVAAGLEDHAWTLQELVEKSSTH